ncbi:hypothetical protein D9611_011474 [Ephemerocybe angulata]|uniref:Nephrocystin 3-like N-terminal domain-containing protein n=1 Tax=Ephemerocybe angulata TaxID=980116 RepID=A0A8H5CDA3_9AGAR|nr:hypothetical protein D9611_011474 [Tulosesus angulatus]
MVSILKLTSGYYCSTEMLTVQSQDPVIYHNANCEITGQTYINGPVYNHYGSQGSRSILNPIRDASYTRNRKQSPPDSNCLPGTRKSILQQVVAWADASVLFNNPHVLWLYGYVGCGKSAIAQTVAEQYARKGRLAGSFFFFRTSPERSKVARLAVTLASQVAAAIPSTAPRIEAALKALGGPDQDPNTISLSSQLQQLVYDPINAARWDRMGLDRLRGPYIIILDGLDECDDHEDLALFIEHLLDFFDRNPRVPLRFFITSRVEEYIRTRLDRSDQVCLVDLVDHTSLEDITIALGIHFASAAIHDRVIQAYGEWPSPADQLLLAKKIGCSYIWMSTIVQFILKPSNDGRTPMDRLPAALKMESGLDDLYTHTLSLAEGLPHFASIIATITLARRPVSILEIAELIRFRVKKFEVVQVLIRLHSIFQVPGNDITPVNLCHISLYDYLTQPKRSGRFTVAPSKHGHLASRCFDILSLEEPLESVAYQYAVDNFGSHLLFNWKELCKRSDLSPGHSMAEIIISHAQRIFRDEASNILTTIYILMDFKSIPRTTTNSRARLTGDGLKVLPEVLRNLGSRYGKLHIVSAFADALKVLEGERTFDLRHRFSLVWGVISRPPLPPLASFYLQLVKLGIKHLLTGSINRYHSSGGVETVEWNIALSTSTSPSPLFFFWCLSTWPQHLAIALEYGLLDWKAINERTAVQQKSRRVLMMDAPSTRRTLKAITEEGSPQRGLVIEGLRCVDKALYKLAGPSNPVIPRGEVTPKAGRSGSSDYKIYDPIVLATMHRAEFSILDLFEVSFIPVFQSIGNTSDLALDTDAILGTQRLVFR